MKCPSCGYEFSIKTDSCPSCGAPLKPSISQKISEGMDKAIGPDGMAPVNAKINITMNRAGLVVMIIILIFEIAIFSYAVPHGVPIYIPAFFLTVTILGMVYTVYTNRRISSVNFSKPTQTYTEEFQKKYGSPESVAKPGTNLFGESPVALDENEVVQIFLTPVYRLQQVSPGMSGVSVERFTENVIIVTSARVLALTVPLPGQGMVIGGGSQDMWNDELKRNTIMDLVQKKIEELKSGRSLEHFPNDFWVSRESLAEVDYLRALGPVKHLYAGAIAFKIKGARKLKYQVVGNTNFDDFISLMNAVKKLAI